MVGRGGGNGNRGTIAKVSGGGGKTEQTLAVKNKFTLLKDQCTGPCPHSIYVYCFQISANIDNTIIQ